VPFILSVIMLSMVMLRVDMVSVSELSVALEPLTLCRNIEYRYVDVLSVALC
jgi:hypothetical protein